MRVEGTPAPGSGPQNRDPVLHIALLIGCAVAIYLSCLVFVNAVEWLGERWSVGPIAVGTVLAAVGTALPESVVTFVAVVFGGSHTTDEIGVGAALGGPLVLATLAYSTVGGLAWVRRRRHPTLPRAAVDLAHLERDQIWFVAIFVFKVGLGLVAFAVKPWLGLAFFAAYIVYFVRELRATGGHYAAPALDPLFLQRLRASPTTSAVLVQTFGSLIVIFGASQLFVHQLEWAGPALGLAPTVVALLLSPIATELPEIMNALIWMRQGKTQLALSNISGAMMIQATVPSGLGLLFTPWRFDGPLLLSGLVTLAAIGWVLTLLHLRRLTPGRLAASGVFYLLFAGLLGFL
jgi:cation:H+ antiporter